MQGYLCPTGYSMAQRLSRKYKHTSSYCSFCSARAELHTSPPLFSSQPPASRVTRVLPPRRSRLQSPGAQAVWPSSIIIYPSFADCQSATLINVAFLCPFSFPSCSHPACFHQPAREITFSWTQEKKKSLSWANLQTQLSKWLH
jgi:hypothetical protein